MKHVEVKILAIYSKHGYSCYLLGNTKSSSFSYNSGRKIISPGRISTSSLKAIGSSQFKTYSPSVVIAHRGPRPLLLLSRCRLETV